MTGITSSTSGTPDEEMTLGTALTAIAKSAALRDGSPRPRFPSVPFALLEAIGATSWNAVPGSRRPPAADELALVRAVARADGSVGRIFDGHLNAVERIAVHAPEAIAAGELDAVRDGRLLAGVWGGDPRPGEGPAATIRRVGAGSAEVLDGVKTFCSGAGGLQRALVLARTSGGGAPALVWIDLTDSERIEIDSSWYRASGLRASVSHRVIFHSAPVLTRCGPPGAIAMQPWFARDALRTAASWAGMADAAAQAALADLAERPARAALDELAAGRILAELATIDVWIACAGRAMDAAADPVLATDPLPGVALNARAAIAGCARRLLDEAARACGSHPFATGETLDRARRDLELFLLQHRLDPLLATAGAAELGRRR